MLTTIPLISALAAITTFVYIASAQAEGGGGRAERSGIGVDTTARSRPKPVVKRTAPKRIVPKKTAAEYEADGDKYYEQKDYDSAVVAYENAVKLKPSFDALYRIGWIYNDFAEYAKALPPLER